MELGIPGSGNGYGSGLEPEGLKREGSGFFGSDDAWRALKMTKTEAAVSYDAHMLRFSSGSKLGSSALPGFHHMEAAQYKNSAGYYSSGGLDASTGVYLLSGVRGPFTPSQWLELEQQALIYRYITANQPIPVHLLIPIRKAFESAGFYGINGSTLKPTAWGWGPFHLGYSNSTDPEPGRCRRTDGKKWRCSRDAVANQKYCDKHMNRGRHRSRKHVEGQGTASGATKSSTTKLITSNGGSSNSIDINQHQNFQGKSLQPTASNQNTYASLNRMIVNRENSGQTLQDATQLSFLSQGISLNCSEHQICSQEPALNGFHLLDSASQKSYGSYTHILNHHREEPESRDSLLTFLDNWPKNNHCSADFMSSTSSPTNEKPATVSPLRLSQEHEIGLGFRSQIHSPREAGNWKPVSWEASMGGPLAEALQSNSISNHADGIGSCQLSSASPTGVLQRSSLVSLSNSSAGSSPRADISKTIERGGSLCTDVLGSASLTCSSSLPALN